jgi:hypothetical protein
VPFDPVLLEKTLQEQRQTAARFAAGLAARSNLAGGILLSGIVADPRQNAGRCN